MKLGLVLMASGFSVRFGGNKLLYPVDGVPMARRVMALFPAVRFDRRVVVSQYDEILGWAGDMGFSPVRNLHPQRGQSESIRLGLSRLKDCHGVLFAVCDQPWLTTASILRLLDVFQARPDTITALSWRGQRGSPVLFPREFFPALLALEGDTGGGSVLRAHLHRLQLVEAGSPRELEDMDVPPMSR